MDNSRGHEPEKYRAHGRRGPSNALKVIVITALVLIGALWIWKAVQVSSVKKEAREENERVRQTAVNLLDENRREQLKLLAKPFVWAVRTEMLRGNMDQVNLYLQDMVKEKNFQRIAVADPGGRIVASTDKKEEGTPVGGGAGTLATDSTMVESVGDSSWLISSPIMGLNSRLGTLLIHYARPKPGL